MVRRVRRAWRGGGPVGEVGEGRKKRLGGGLAGRIDWGNREYVPGYWHCHRGCMMRWVDE